jgi:hypothetical protein
LTWWARFHRLRVAYRPPFTNTTSTAGPILLQYEIRLRICSTVRRRRRGRPAQPRPSAPPPSPREDGCACEEGLVLPVSYRCWPGCHHAG